jgi:hypothetical protein
MRAVMTLSPALSLALSWRCHGAVTRSLRPIGIRAAPSPYFAD